MMSALAFFETDLRKNLRFHVFFWLGYFLLNFIRWGHYFGDYAYSFESNLVEFPIHILLVYFNLYYLIPRFIPSRPALYISLILLATLIMSLVRIVITYQLVTTEIWRESIITQTSLFNINYILAVFIGELYVVGLTMAIKLTMDWIRSERRAQELLRLNNWAELSMLRSQMQPHFFFNTLNNLYSLTLDKSEEAPETVLKLSELMSHMVYEAHKNQVSLSSEIQTIRNYIDLEKLRYGERLVAHLKIDGQLENKKVPPLLMMPFIENCFKHGVNSTSGQLNMDVKFVVDDTDLHFQVSNNREEKSSAERNTQEEKPHGVGISNTLRRLDLLFANRYQLEIQEEKQAFKVNLSVPLT